MLYICIPAHNEASTIGLLIWRIRKVFQGYSREYEILVYDDASTDGTAELLAPYAEVAPLTLIRGETHKGYGQALEILAREASRRTRYPRRDGMVIMQADFTDPPEHLPELAKRFEGGADIVLAERGAGNQPTPVDRLRRWARWALRFSVQVRGVNDPFATLRVYRISLVRDLIKARGDKPLITSDGWAANAELLMDIMPLARRVEPLTLEPRYDLRTRESRIKPFANALAVFRFGRAARGRSIVAPAQQPTTTAAQPAKSGRGNRKSGNGTRVTS